MNLIYQQLIQNSPTSDSISQCLAGCLYSQEIQIKIVSSNGFDWSLCLSITSAHKLIGLFPCPSQVYSHEESLKDTDGRYNREMTRLNNILVQLEGELVQVRTQVERHVDDYQELLHVKMKLEAEIENYRSLMHDIAPDDR